VECEGLDDCSWRAAVEAGGDPTSNLVEAVRPVLRAHPHLCSAIGDMSVNTITAFFVAHARVDEDDDTVVPADLESHHAGEAFLPRTEASWARYLEEARMPTTYACISEIAVRVWCVSVMLALQ
jgi:hypothetical protein